MYKRTIVKRYTASQLRARLSEALDEVERGGEVSVERGARTFRIVADDPRGRKAGRKKLDFELYDERLLLRGWTWAWDGPGRKMKIRPGIARRRGRS
jgi:antitoxin (DNA-binding transcriptional repressor) of toxin-antitoxin stability system